MPVGMYEVVDNKVGESMQVYCNPEYKSDSEMAPMALKKNGLRVEFLKGHKTFAENYEAIRDFIADSELICFGNVQISPLLIRSADALASRSSRTRRQTSMRSLSCRGAAQMESCVFIWMAASSERMRTQRLR